MTTRIDPVGNYNFKVELDGIAVAGFSEVSGLESTIEMVEYREGGDNSTVRKLPGRASYSDIVLRKGTTGGDNTLFEWHQQTVQGDIERRNGSIIVFDRDGVTEIVRYNFFNAWPMTWSPADMNATANEVAIEELTLAHEGLELA